jgi:precorrin-8X/cobalt-precorrin-8 methylmutase
MTVELRQVAPADIEAESFAIIDKEIGPHSFDQATYQIVRRVIHATGDFSFKDTMRFAPGAIDQGLAAIRRGCDILTDVTMTASGISKALLARWGGKVVCLVGDEALAETAKKENCTRSELAIRRGLTENVGIIAIGNAPTALVEAVRLAALMPKGQAPLIVGLPVGFVNAAESKALLVEKNSCYITSLGRKGGSPTAAATVNALLRLAATLA